MAIFAYSYTDPLLDTVPEANSWGWEVDRVYEDLGKRLQLQKLLTDCQENPPKYLLVRSLQELGDTLEQVGTCIAQLQALGITLIAIEQSYNSSDDSRNKHIELINLIQQIQYQQRSRRIRQGHARKRLDVAPPPGKVPYGYRRGKDKYIIDRTTAPVVKEFFENFLLYGSLQGAVRYIAKKYNKKISVTTGKRWLTNQVYRGNTEYQNGEIISNTHAPIIGKEEAAQIDRLLRRNSRLSRRAASAPRSLAGLVTCSECKSSMTITRVTIRKQAKEYLYLRPINCAKKPKCQSIPYQDVLEKTITAICCDLPKAVEGLNFPQVDTVKNNLEQEIARAKTILEKIPDLVETCVLDEETAKLRTYKLLTEISAMEAKLATLPPINLRSVAQAVSIPQFWLDLSESERRFYLREFIKEIQIIRQDSSWELQIVFIF
ncbi:MAG: recombinase family protein [Calothrix sp. C42_A2020_038]|nr:recombinase family protein [Calothrix sp. C42_A2020_038]